MTRPTAFVQCGPRDGFDGAWRPGIDYDTAAVAQGYADRGWELRPLRTAAASGPVGAVLPGMPSGIIPPEAAAQLTPRTPVIGGLRAVYDALRVLGRPQTPGATYPQPLRRFMVGAPRSATLEEAFWLVSQAPRFVKPQGDAKLFTGFLAADADALWSMTAHLLETTRVWVVRPARFVSEFRCVILDGKVQHVGPYKGDPLVPWQPDGIREMIAAWPDAPRAWTLDVGVLEDGRQVLVEVNGGIAYGLYGTGPYFSSLVHMAAWEDLCGLEPGALQREGPAWAG